MGGHGGTTGTMGETMGDARSVGSSSTSIRVQGEARGPKPPRRVLLTPTLVRGDCRRHGPA